MYSVFAFSSLKPGDHLSVKGALPLNYNHHGIYLGPNRGVAEMGIRVTIEDLQLTNPRIVSLDEFQDKDRIYRINYKPKTYLPPKHTVRQAQYFVDNPTKWDRFNLLLNNCEHFATKCKTGKAVSKQVTDKIRSLLG